MTRYAIFTSVTLLFSCVVAGAETKPQSKSSVVWEVGGGIQTPESVCYDPSSRVLFVSNIGTGGPTGKDGDGFISKLGLDGRIVALKWVTGLDAPKGMRVHEGTLWVSDIDRLVAIDIAEGQVRTTIPVPGATFLNDVACGTDGTVFVSDTMNSRILCCRDGKVSVFIEGDELECPNGLLVLDDRLIVAAWGRDPGPDFSTKVPGRLLSVDLKTKQVTPISPGPTGNHDGLESDGADGFFVTDWILGKILHVAGNGSVKLVAQLTKGTADLARVPEKNLLIVPEMMENKVTAMKHDQ